jgi:CMP/dCMP kinase
MIIAVDGPAASGKGTLARRLAEHYGLAYLDTGSLYRAVALAVLKCGQVAARRGGGGPSGR